MTAEPDRNFLRVLHDVGFEKPTVDGVNNDAFGQWAALRVTSCCLDGFEVKAELVELDLG